MATTHDISQRLLNHAAKPGENEFLVEAEITPAMIAAGEDVLLSALGGAVDTHWFPADLAISVYRAMVAHAPRERRSGHAGSARQDRAVGTKDSIKAAIETTPEMIAYARDQKQIHDLMLAASDDGSDAINALTPKPSRHTRNRE